MIVRKLLSRAGVALLLATSCWAFAGAAWALSLGNATVQSSLGQVLNAELEVTSTSDAEAQTLQAGLANAQTYAAANLEYPPVLQGLKVSLQQRGAGKAIIRISSQRAINEPVLQVLLDVRWNTGKMVRALTLFIDPPQAASTGSTSLVEAVPSKAITPEPIPALDAPAAPDGHAALQGPAASEIRAETSETVLAAPGPVLATSSTESAKVERRKLMVQKGQTARQIVAHIPARDYTPEQLMLALLRANPDAFVDHNINRLKAGASLTLQPLPDPQAPSQTEAAKEVARQSAVWRKHLLAMTHSRPAEKAAGSDEGRSTNKKVGEASTPAKPAQDKDELKLGAAKEKDKADAEKLAADMQAKEDAQRKAELAKNIEALKEASAKASAPTAPGSDEAAAGSKADAPKVAASLPSPPPPQAEPQSGSEAFLSYLASLDPLTTGGAGGALLLLLVLLWYRQRAAARAEEASGSDQATGPSHEGLTDASNTGVAAGTDSTDASVDGLAAMQDLLATQPAPQSVLFADSQLKPSDSLDAVAEADVYLAYGRDAQAEEILREALSVTPNKFELHQKLLDIFVLRGDSDAFSQVAQTMSTYLDSQGPQWLRVCEMGALLDSKNPLYQNHASPDSLGTGTPLPPAVMPTPMEFPAGLDLNLAKPLAGPNSATAGTQDFRPSTQIQPLGFEFSSQNLMLAPDGKTPLDTAQPWSNPDMDEGARLLEQKLELAKEFIAVSDIAGARILLNEVIERAQGAQLEQAKQLLAQIG